MKNFFTDWLTFTFIIAVVWFGGRGMGYINLEKTFEEQVRVAAMAEIEPDEIEILKIEGMSQDPPSLESFELKAPTARFGRLKIRDLYISINGMIFEEGKFDFKNYYSDALVPKNAKNGKISFQLLWKDLEESISKIAKNSIPKVFLNKEIKLINISGQLQLVIGDEFDSEMIPSELIIEEKGLVRFRIYPSNWLLKELPEAFRDQTLAEMPGYKGLGWVWTQEYSEEAISFLGTIDN
tara:strand:+ start:559 stop:1272 length:714 start_codon:yes stop_codon:yes gene_type:complete